VSDATASPVQPAKDGGNSGGTKNVGESTIKQVEVDPLKDPKSPLAKRSIFFEYDSYEISAAGRSVVEEHSKYLRSHPNQQIRIEGHADERGGREYNLALGQKRSDAVRKAMSLLGVAEKQVESVSFGKEKPQALGHDEESWAKNRRADVAYQGN
jgi:peptidoglycan-associated lipoprotein